MNVLNHADLVGHCRDCSSTPSKLTSQGKLMGRALLFYIFEMTG